MSTCACAPRQHTAVHKNSPMTLFSSSLCPNAVCRDTVYNISGKTDDLLSNAELHKNKTIQKKNTEESPYSWIWVPTVLQSTEAIKDLQGAGLFHCTCRWETAITSGEAHKGVWIFTCYFAEKKHQHNQHLCCLLSVSLRCLGSHHLDCSGGGSFGGSNKGEVGTALRSGRGLLGEARLTGEGSSIFLREQRKKRIQRGNTGRCTKCRN